MVQHQPIVKLGAAFYYGTASFVVQFVNKSLFTTFLFPFPVMVALLQLAFMAPVCYGVARPKLEMRTVWTVLPLSFVNVMNVVSGLISTGGLSVPMFIALRRFTLLITLLIERFLYGKRHNTVTKVTASIMIAGAFLAAWTDATFNLYGYIAIITNDIFTALYLVLVKNIKGLKELTTVELIFYNSALSLPMLLLGFFASGEADRLGEFPSWAVPSFQVVLSSTVVLGITIHHSTFICTRVNEPLMTMVAGQLKNIVSTIVGALVFSDFKFLWMNVVGLTISMIGALWYAIDGTLRTQSKTELLPRSDLNGISEKLKNYTQLKQENGAKVIPIVTANGHTYKDEA